MKLQFGNKEHIDIAKSRKRKVKQTSIEVNDDVKEAIVYKLCTKCSKVKMSEIMKVSVMFARICNECKERFCEKANKIPLIGGLIKIERQINN